MWWPNPDVEKLHKRKKLGEATKTSAPISMSVTYHTVDYSNRIAIHTGGILRHRWAVYCVGGPHGNKDSHTNGEVLSNNGFEHN